LGRAREVEEIVGLLGRTAAVRLLTLTGAGGIGKTRLGIEAARKAGLLFPGGAAFVALAPLDDAALVIPTVSQALGLRETAGTRPLELLRHYLRERRFLLVLDNFEHVAEAALEVVALLGSCPNLSVLVTSRAPLRVRGEREYPVSPLAVPDPTRIPEAEEVARTPAAGLFVERAQEAAGAFELTAANAAAVASICWRLDGLPLALELAAAQTRFLSPTALFSRLDQALQAGGARDLPERQKTMRATLDWSCGLLSNEDEDLFARLSVFVGGFTLEAAEYVCASDAVEAEDAPAENVLVPLGNLVEQSLVVAEMSPKRDTRYRMLEPIRQYAVERLREAGDEEEVRWRHARYYLEFAEEAEPELKGAQQVEWLDRLEKDHGNLRGAIRWALEEGETEMALRLTASAAHLRYPRGYLNEGRNQLEAALAGGAGSPAARAKALTEVGWFALEQSDHEEAQRLLEESLIMYRELGDTYGVAHALECLGVAKTRLGDNGQALQLHEESLALYRALDHKWGIAISLNNLGIVAQKQGEYEKATTYYQESLALMRVVGDSLSIGSVLDGLGQLFMIQGQLERSATLLAESQELLRKLGDKLTLSTTLRDLAETISRQGDCARAADAYKESLMLATQVGSKATVAGCLEGLGEVALTLGQPARAARLWGAVETMEEAFDIRITLPARSVTDHEAAARSNLDETTWEAAWNEGRTMTPEQAIQYALEPSSGSPTSENLPSTHSDE
jgi:predicted ATPase/uncharacterized protein HemY